MDQICGHKRSWILMGGGGYKAMVVKGRQLKGIGKFNAMSCDFVERTDWNVVEVTARRQMVTWEVVME